MRGCGRVCVCMTALRRIRPLVCVCITALRRIRPLVCVYIYNCASTHTSLGVCVHNCASTHMPLGVCMTSHAAWRFKGGRGTHPFWFLPTGIRLSWSKCTFSKYRSSAVMGSLCSSKNRFCARPRCRHGTTRYDKYTHVHRYTPRKHVRAHTRARTHSADVTCRLVPMAVFHANPTSVHAHAFSRRHLPPCAHDGVSCEPHFIYIYIYITPLPCTHTHHSRRSSPPSPLPPPPPAPACSVYAQKTSVPVPAIRACTRRQGWLSGVCI